MRNWCNSVARVKINDYSVICQYHIQCLSWGTIKPTVLQQRGRQPHRMICSWQYSYAALWNPWRALIRQALKTAVESSQSVGYFSKLVSLNLNVVCQCPSLHLHLLIIITTVRFITSISVFSLASLFYSASIKYIDYLPLREAFTFPTGPLTYEGLHTNEDPPGQPTAGMCTLAAHMLHQSSFQGLQKNHVG